MKKILTLLLMLQCFYLHAQETIKLRLDNPEPRVGDEVLLSFNIDFLSDEIQSQIGDGVELNSSSSGFASRCTEFNRSLVFEKNGRFVIGPFKFEFNGRNISTDAVEIVVAEKLPFREGIWVRLVESTGTKYIIIEQLIKNEADYKKEKNSFSYTVGGVKSEKEKFATITEKPQQGVEISFRGSKSHNITSPDSEIFAPGLSYSFKKYEVKFNDDFEGDFKLLAKHFIDLPRNAKFDVIEIKK